MTHRMNYRVSKYECAIVFLNVELCYDNFTKKNRVLEGKNVFNLWNAGWVYVNALYSPIFKRAIPKTLFKAPISVKTLLINVHDSLHVCCTCLTDLLRSTRVCPCTCIVYYTSKAEDRNLCSSRLSN